MIKKVNDCLNQLNNCKLLNFKLACEMMMFDFGNIGLHCQGLTRVIKNNDILFTTLDYQTWDGNINENNDECFFYKKYRDSIIGGVVMKIDITATFDLRIFMDNGVIIESLILNGYNHYDTESEQWRLMMNTDKEDSIHMVVYNKYIEFSDEIKK